MSRLVLCACMLCLPWLTLADDAGAVHVLAGPEVKPIHDALQRLKRPFSPIEKLSRDGLAGCRVLILCGTKPPVDEAGKRVVEAFLQEGGAVLAVGGGATCMIDHKLVDATGYYLTGTTIHMTSFQGYHRLTFGYPGAKPVGNWKSGVSSLLRATEGPLMMPGPKATSILRCDSAGHSAAIIQRVGKGLALLIGPDPQGGNAYYELNKPKLQPGDKLKTDRLLDNAVAFLLDPHTNVIPNSGFEENTKLAKEFSNWQITLKNGAKSEWCTQDAPEGKQFVKIVCPEAKSSGVVQPTRPIVVEAGRRYRFTCRYRSNGTWRLKVDARREKPPKQDPLPPKAMPESAAWQQFAAEMDIPPDVSYVLITATKHDKGELCLDDVTLQLMPR